MRSPERAAGALAPARSGLAERRDLDEGWEVAHTDPGVAAAPAGLPPLQWTAATVPGTAAGALRSAGRWRPEEPAEPPLDERDWWFRTSFTAAQALPGEEVVLRFGGIATVSEIFLNGQRIGGGESMFASYEIDVGERLGEHNELVVCARALAPLLAERRRPRQRWRTRLVADANLRFFRTMLMGRTPGFAPGPAAVGPWRPVTLERRERIAIEDVQVRTELDGATGIVRVRARLRTIGAGETSGTSAGLRLSGPSGEQRAELATEPHPGGGSIVSGELRVPDPALWWPHTHGDAALHDVGLELPDARGAIQLPLGRVGFRSLRFAAGEDHDMLRDGIDLHVNGVRVFARGAVWTPADIVGMSAPGAELRELLLRARDAGMNMLRIPGTSCYESESFHALCDELGVLVWQDFMFANLDYPIEAPELRAAITREAEAVLRSGGAHPSLAVVCGNSEIEQQVAMFGLQPELGRGELFGELLPALVEHSGVDALYVPSAPCGGDMPFRTDRGIANYYGVGGYMRPLSDARLAGVRFAAECLAFANVPDEAGVERVLRGASFADAAGRERWKAGLTGDVGTDWDFEDVRDHYLAELFGVEPSGLREQDPERYLELSRAVTGEVMADVLGEWRRTGSTCGGALVLWLRDLLPGAGWGLLDDAGRAKTAYHHVRRALAPVAVWTTDEGLGGIDIHAANDRPEALRGSLRVGLYAGFERPVGDARIDIELPPHGSGSWGVEALLGRFVDASWAYRFGPPAQDLIAVTLERREDEGAALISQAFRFPAGRPLTLADGDSLGLKAVLSGGSAREPLLRVSSTRFAYGVRVHAQGCEPSDDGFSIEPGGERLIALGAAPGTPAPRGHVTALNLGAAVPIVTGDEA
jgi:beta-mannosidase